MENTSPLSLKEEGNSLFADSRFEEALRKYSQAISLLRESRQDDGLLTTLYSNRCACYLGMEDFHKAIEVPMPFLLPPLLSFSFSFFLF